MTSQLPTITAELRKWQRKDLGGVMCVTGLVYNDQKAIWTDGDKAVIYPVLQWVESPNFWVAYTNTSGWKCMKDEELTDAGSG